MSILNNLGMCSLLEFDTLEEQIELCKNLGLSFIELNMDLPCFYTEKLKEIDFLKIYKVNNIFLTFHLPENLDIGCLNEDLRKTYLKILKDTISIIPENSLINLHLNTGVYFTMPDKKVYIADKHKERFLDNIRESIESVAPLLKDKNITLCIENLGKFHLNFMKEAADIILSYENTGITHDIGHEAKGLYNDSDFINKNISKIKHIHIHDFDGNKDHLELFTGKLDIQKHLNFIKNNNIKGVIEVKTSKGLRNSLEKIKHIYES